MKRARWLLLPGMLMLALAAAWAWQARQALADFPAILPAYSAKEYCSCRFVMGFEAAYCRAYVKQYLPLDRLDEDITTHRVTAEGLGRRAQAGLQGPGEGCRLLP
ncbi:amidase [Pseudomonas sp.]|uniref:amidase n=1 Tax=Pseudomonas sp. TaxID=306 RepID=UPI0028ADFBD0|nr:amidase [Pseudomonas sp.]